VALVRLTRWHITCNLGVYRRPTRKPLAAPLSEPTMTPNDCHRTLRAAPKGHALSRDERIKAALLSAWFFSCIGALWLLKPVRTASLLAHLGAEELPYLRFGAVAAVGLVVLAYSRVVNRFSRLDVVRGSSLMFAFMLLGFWLALRLGGGVLGAQRWFVWAVFIVVEIYSTVMVSIFWTYTNDVMSHREADRLYGPIGLGGILGGIAGGVLVDTLVERVGPVDMLLVCIGLVLVGGGIAWVTEAVLNPPSRVIAPPTALAQVQPRSAGALEGAREVFRSRYLLCIVAIVLAYEFAAAVTDFVINVVFERAFEREVAIAQMYGRLGWIVSGTALVSQLVIVPRLLPFKRAALLVPPVVMLCATFVFGFFPVVAVAIVLAASDRGLNYSLQQVAKETLYVPLSDAQKYKAKAFIDIVVDRAGKALSSVCLQVIIAVQGVSIATCVVLAIAALLVWAVAANALGRAYAASNAAAKPSQDEPAAERAPLAQPLHHGDA
jgi:AAA family ATP:ADP antiporter